jgi:hypothetical protein
VVNVAIAVDNVFSQFLLSLFKNVRYFKRELLYFGGAVVKNNKVQAMIKKGERVLYEDSWYVFG